ncbi:PTS sugar transporter subunit IIA [Shewanella hanedai]|uniref:DUF3389 family protein n=1 Tax=Shewanella hanedai TaxID=25 RepID=A0A553JMI7_SHEHA|nr:DUF3389 family protein [Shewanella hanedai]TRY13666.1 DUF3389 family protein [Shewanella hanedai]GGI98469.1 PTS sugar transporter subunit IIA [Shewanella hanedai]
MVIDFSQGKIILTPFEVQIKLSASGSGMYAMAEDLTFIDDALIISADAGSIKWSLRLDTLEQLLMIRAEIGIG